MKIHFSKLTALTIALMVSVTAFAQKKSYFDINFNKCKAKAAYYYRIVTPEGSQFLVKDYFMSNDQLQMEGRYNNKKLPPESKNGLFTYYYKNGQKSAEGEYVNGKNHGKWSAWFADGQLKSEGSYDMDNREGEWSFYHRNGTLKLKMTYKNGDREGHFLNYYDDGTKYEELDFVKGRKDGKYTIYFKGTGKVKSTYNYLKDSLDGAYEEFWPDGKLAAKGNYSDNKADGTFEFFHSNGNMSCQAEYKKNKFVKATFFDEEGKKLNKKVTEEDLIVDVEYPGGKDEMRDQIAKKWSSKADVANAQNNNFKYYFVVKLTVDAEGNITESEWVYPDEDDDGYDDEYQFKKYMAVAIEDFPKLKPAKKYNRFYEGTFYVDFYLVLKK